MSHVPKPRADKSPAPSAYSSALGWLARRDHSTRELKTKLAARGHAASEAGEAIGRLKEQRYQSDERFAETLARSRAGQGYGPRRIRAELKSHGLGEPLIRATLTGLDVDFEASAASVRRASISWGVRRLSRAAANSIANGKPSRQRHNCPMICASVCV